MIPVILMTDNFELSDKIAVFHRPYWMECLEFIDFGLIRRFSALA